MKAWIDLGYNYYQDKQGRTFGRGTDAFDVPDMAIPLGTYLHNPVGGQKFDKPTELWTCKHYDAENRVCGNYEKRPGMCRNYPDTNRCAYRACSWKGHRKPPARSGLQVI